MEEFEKISWPGWEIGKCIGRGGFGAVYELHREVFGDVEKKALKVITIPKDDSEIEYMRCEGMDDESITTTFHSQVGDIIREYKMMSKLNENPHIVHCDDFRYNRHEDGLGWDIFIKMELLTPLMKAMDQVQTEAQIVRLGKELCTALISCQELNVIHRDIKPQNIFLSPKGNFKLGDFGIARTVEHTTKATVGVGTYSFMAPEVALGKEYGSTVDIYSLGLVLYWLLNERRGPFVPLPPAVPTAAINEEARRRRYSGEKIPEPKNGSDALKAIILKACAFDPKARYQTAREMLSALNGLESGDDNRTSVVYSEAEISSNLQQSQEEETVLDSRDYAVLDERKKTPVEPEKVPEKPKKKKQLLWSLIVGAAVVILAVVLFLVFAGSSDDAAKAVPTMVPTEAQTVVTEAPVPQNVLRADPIDLIWSETTQEYEGQPVFDTNIMRDEILSITFRDTLEAAPEDAWDVSAGATRSVLAWTVPNGEYYELFIAGDGGVIAPEDAAMLFALYRNVEKIDFAGCFTTDNVTDMSRLFAYCHKLTTLDLSGWNTASVDDMHAMFIDCHALERVALNDIDTSGVSNMAQMFSDCSSLTALDLQGFNTSLVRNMQGLFSDCSSLQSLDLSSFDTSRVTDMSYMFYGCRQIKELELTSFNTVSVTDMSHMFDLCSELVNLDISNFDTGKVTDMSFMFFDCNSLKNLQLGTFNTDNVEKHDDFMINWKMVNGKTWKALFRDYVAPAKSTISKKEKENDKKKESKNTQETLPGETEGAETIPPVESTSGGESIPADAPVAEAPSENPSPESNTNGESANAGEASSGTVPSSDAV